MEWVRAAYPECHVLFVPGDYTAELQPADILILEPLKHIIKQQAMQFFAESACRDEAVLDLRLGTMERLVAQWVLHACAEVEKHEHHNESLAPLLSWTFEEAPRLAARATREHLYGTLFEKEPTFDETDLFRIPLARLSRFVDALNAIFSFVPTCVQVSWRSTFQRSEGECMALYGCNRPLTILKWVRTSGYFCETLVQMTTPHVPITVSFKSTLDRYQALNGLIQLSSVGELI